MFKSTLEQPAEQLELLAQQYLEGFFFVVNHVVTEVSDVCANRAFLIRALHLVILLDTLLVRIELKQGPEGVKYVGCLIIGQSHLVLEELQVERLVLRQDVECVIIDPFRLIRVEWAEEPLHVLKHHLVDFVSRPDLAHVARLQHVLTEAHMLNCLIKGLRTLL